MNNFICSNEAKRRLRILGLSTDASQLQMSTNMGIVNTRQDVAEYAGYLSEKYDVELYHVIQCPAVTIDRYVYLAVSQDSSLWSAELVAKEHGLFDVYAYFMSLHQDDYEAGTLTIQNHRGHLVYVPIPNLSTVLGQVPCPGKK